MSDAGSVRLLSLMPKSDDLGSVLISIPRTHTQVNKDNSTKLRFDFHTHGHTQTNPIHTIRVN